MSYLPVDVESAEVHELYHEDLEAKVRGGLFITLALNLY